MSNKWSRDESILALALYCKTPYSKIKVTNNEIIELAKIINRTPDAVTMKMWNLGRFDSDLRARGNHGLPNGSKLDKEVWDEFHANMESLFEEAEKIAGANNSLLLVENDDYVTRPIGENVPTTSQARKGQQYFRNTVLSAYNNTCCITGLEIPVLLQASHIKPWRDSDPITERTNPVNGLCLNVLHHKAFDKGIITIDTDYKIIVSKLAKEKYSSQVFNDYFLKYEGQSIKLPDRFLPSKEFLEYHNSQLIGF